MTPVHMSLLLNLKSIEIGDNDISWESKTTMKIIWNVY